MRCIWQMDGDAVKGFKCDFTPIDMLTVCNGLKYIMDDAEQHPKNRERATHIYNTIMLCRYENEEEKRTEEFIQGMKNLQMVADRKTEPQYDAEEVAKDINRRVEMTKKEWNARHIDDEPQTEADWKDRMWAEAVIASKTENE